MYFEQIVAVIIVLAIVIAGCLPRLYVDFKFIQNFFAAMKEVVATIREAIQNDVQEESDMHADGSSKLTDAEKYYIRKVVLFVRLHKKQSVFFCLAVIITILFLRQWILFMPELERPQMSEGVLLPIDLIAFFGYWLCKSKKRKWQYSLLLIVIDLLQIIWKLFVMHSPFIVMDTMLLIVWIFIFGNYYFQWRMENEKNLMDLSKKMQENATINAQFMKQYQFLLEQRHDNKKHFNMLYYLNQEKEITAMQEYLEQLEQERLHYHDAK